MDDELPDQPKSFRWKRLLLWLGGIALILLIGLGIAAYEAWNHVQPFLRGRVVDTLSSRFHANVQLDDFHATAADDFAVTGSGLSITPLGMEQYPPVITVKSFAFHMRLREIFNPDRHVRLVVVDGLHITLPPGPARQQLTQNLRGDDQDSGEKKHNITLPKLYVDAIVAHDAILTLMTDNPAKPPRQFDIHSLHLDTVGVGAAMRYTADLHIPKPSGEVHATGDFGPWNATDPRTTPITGDYTFDHADLATTKGIAGILNSTGHFSGPMDYLTVDGQAEVPDFRIDEANHAVDLTTTYHAIVDGTTGDTYLQPVHAHFRNTWFTCAGSIEREKQGDKSIGHHITLKVDMTKGRIEDLLWLAVKTTPSPITGNVQLHNTLDLPPDPTHTRTFTHRLGLKGVVTITQMNFSSPDMEKKVESMSLRSQGDPKDANSLKNTAPNNIQLDGTLNGNFTLQQDVLGLTPATFTLPGLNANVSGTYALDGQQYDFHGDAKLDAKVSQMVTGWRSTLLKPFDKLLAKHGAGTYIPFHISGTKDSPKFGIDFGKL